MAAVTATHDIRRRLDDAPMSRAQVAAVAVTVALSALDGYDLLSVTFAAPAISHSWGIGKAALGVVLSSGLAGMALGSFLLAPLADVIGRRKLVFLTLILMAAGMLLSAFAGSLPQLAGWRVLTGLGIGALVPVINPLAAEFANARRRRLAPALMAMGYPVGGLAGGLLSAGLMKSHGWPAVFLAGFGATLLMIPVVAVFLPEPLDFLLARRGPDSLAKVNRLLKRCGHEPVAALPDAAAVQRKAYAVVFAPGQIGTTARMTVVNLCTSVAVYYILSWMPQMVADSGFAPATASLVSACAQLTGILGGVLLGWLARREGLNRLTGAMQVGLGLSIAVFALTPPSLPLLMLAAAACGYFLFSGVAGFYGILATVFSAEARAAGSGFVMGVGRVGSALGPLVAGWLFASGLTRGQVSIAFGSLAVVAGLLLALGPVTGRSPGD